MIHQQLYTRPPKAVRVRDELSLDARYIMVARVLVINIYEGRGLAVTYTQGSLHVYGVELRLKPETILNRHIRCIYRLHLEDVSKRPFACVSDANIYPCAPMLLAQSQGVLS